MSASVRSRRNRSIAALRETRVIQAAGFAGMPSSGQRSERRRERLLNGVLGGIEVAENADQGRDRPPRLTPEQAIDDLETRLRYETASALVCSSEPDAS